MKIAVILPSRGMIFSQTAEEILQNLKGLPYRFFFSHKQPIPRCFEQPTVLALKDPEITHLWFVEDDMILSPETLTELLKANVEAITCDYPVSAAGQGAVFLDEKNKVVFSGTGCLLVKREVFDRLTRPYFRSDIHWGATYYGSYIRMTTSISGRGLSDYGLHDVTFGIKLYVSKSPIKLSPIRCGQRKLKAMGKSGTNHGAHQIDEWTEIVPHYLRKHIEKADPLPTGELVTIATPNGEVETDRVHAAKLIEAGLAIKAEERYIVIDDTANLL
jgi:hypothetical protein